MRRAVFRWSICKEAPRQPIPKALNALDGLGMNICPIKRANCFIGIVQMDVEFAISNLCTRAIKPQATPIQIGENYARVQNSTFAAHRIKPVRQSINDNGVGLGPKRCLLDIARSHSPFFRSPWVAAWIDQIRIKLMAASLFDSPNYAKLFPVGDAGRLFTDAEVRAMMLIEGTPNCRQAQSPKSCTGHSPRLARLQIDPAGLGDATRTNGVSVPGVAEFKN